MTDIQPVLIKFSEEEVQAIDRLRDTTPRTVWIKALCQMAVLAREKYGDACYLTMTPISNQTPDVLVLPALGPVERSPEPEVEITTAREVRPAYPKGVPKRRG